jgi:hypothetical protein
MRSADEILATARDESPFSNGTAWELWSANWCYRPCMNPVEAAYRRYEEGKRKTPPKDFPGGCPLILCAMLGKTPTEWLEQPDDGYQRDYHCIEFMPPDDGRGGMGAGPPRPPRAKRERKDQIALFPRPDRQRRMLKQPEDLSVPSEMVPV